MTNQTIDGVPRELIEILIGDAGSLSKRHASHILRALLDAEPVMCHGCMTESVSPDHFDSAGKCKAAQPQGEPVAWMAKRKNPTGNARLDRPLLLLVGEDGWGPAFECVPLYAEQRAPVAVAFHEPLDHSDGLHTYEYVKGYNDAISLALNPPGAR